MVASVLVINSVYPAIVRSSNSLTRVAQRMDDRIESHLSVVYGTGELDENAVWQDTDSDNDFDVHVWVKNVGSARIIGIDQTDIFFGTEGDFSRIPHSSYAGATYPRWDYTVENGSEWINSVTVRFDIHYDTASLDSGTYQVKLIVPTGAYDEHFFSF